MNSSSCSKINSPTQSAFRARPRRRSSAAYPQGSMPGMDWPTEPRIPRTSLATSKTRGSKRGKPLLQTPLQIREGHLAHFWGEQYVQSTEMQCVVFIDRNRKSLPNHHPDAYFRKPCRSRFSSPSPRYQRPGKSARTCFEGPFGEVLRATGSMAKANPFRFSTKYQDDETDLLYYGYRYYNASTGRWLTRDPIEEHGLQQTAQRDSASLDINKSELFESVRRLGQLSRRPTADEWASLKEKIGMYNQRAGLHQALGSLQPELSYGFLRNNGLNDVDFLGLISINEPLWFPCPAEFDSACAIYCAIKYREMGFCRVKIYETPDGKIHFDFFCVCFECPRILPPRSSR
jgi:RHS repeat-associated protein